MTQEAVLSGGSAVAGKSIAQAWLVEREPKCIVDVGAGRGLWRELAHEQLAPCRWVAVETWWPTIERYLAGVYDEVIHADARWVDWKKILLRFNPDVVLLGDVLEHMPLADALELVRRIRRFGLEMLVSLPIVEWPQDAVEGNPYERHVQTWTHEQAMKSLQPIRSAVDFPIGVYYL